MKEKEEVVLVVLNQVAVVASQALHLIGQAVGDEGPTDEVVA